MQFFVLKISSIKKALPQCGKASVISFEVVVITSFRACRHLEACGREQPQAPVCH